MGTRIRSVVVPRVRRTLPPARSIAVVSTRSGPVMTTSSDRERGETLVEILISIVVLGLIASASFYSISVGATSSKSHRDFVTADALLRDSAEATKAAVRTSCVPGGTTYSVPYSTLIAPDGTTWLQYYQTSRHFTLPTDLTNPCPSATQAPVVTLSIYLPDSTQKTLSIEVRTP